MSEEKLLTAWYNRLRELKNIHFQASKTFRKYHYFSGIPLVILAAIANAGLWAVFIEMAIFDDNTVKLILAIIGTVITVLSAIQAFLGFDKRSEMHKNSAIKYSSLCSETDLLLNQEGTYTTEDLIRIKDKWNMITENAPLLPNN